MTYILLIKECAVRVDIRIDPLVDDLALGMYLR